MGAAHLCLVAGWPGKVLSMVQGRTQVNLVCRVGLRAFMGVFLLIPENTDGAQWASGHAEGSSAPSPSALFLF